MLFFSLKNYGDLRFFSQKTFKVVELTPYQGKWSILKINPLVGRGYTKWWDLDHPTLKKFDTFLRQDHGFWFWCRKYHNSYNIFFNGTEMTWTIFKMVWKVKKRSRIPLSTVLYTIKSCCWKILNKKLNTAKICDITQMQNELVDRKLNKQSKRK